MYDNYIEPKLRPYTVVDTLELAIKQISVCFLEHDMIESELQKLAPENHNWENEEEPVSIH